MAGLNHQPIFPKNVRALPPGCMANDATSAPTLQAKSPFFSVRFPRPAAEPDQTGDANHIHWLN